MSFFGNKRRDFSIQPPRQQVDGTPFFVTDSDNIDFTLENLNLTANLTFTGVAAGTYGDATHIPILEIDQWGRVTGVTTTTFSASGIALEVNGTLNGSQTILNLSSGTDIQVVDLGGGVVQFNYTGSSGNTYTVNNGLSPESSNPNNFQLGGNLVKITEINLDSSYQLKILGKTNKRMLDITNGTISLGDIDHTNSSVGASNALYIDSSYTSFNYGGYNFFYYNVSSWKFGDIDNRNLGTKLVISDFGQKFEVLGQTDAGNDQPFILVEFGSPTAFVTIGDSSLNGNGTYYQCDDLFQIHKFTKDVQFSDYGSGSKTGIPTYALGVDASGNVVEFTGGGGGSGTVTSVAATVPNPTNPAFSVNVPNPTTTPSIDITANGIVSQYIRGDGSLANFPNSTGGGASVNYYLNGSISQGTFGGSTYYQMSRTPVLGGGTNFIRTNGAGNGYIASFITDAGDPSFLNIPGGNWNLELYFQSSATGGSPQFYGEIYKVDVTNVFTLVASGSTNPEGITNGTTVDQYFTSIPVPQTSLLITDRLAIRIYVITNGRTITLHTENGNLCEVLTTFTTGLTALNGLTNQVQNFATPGTSGLAPNWNSVSPDHTLNIPLASASSVTAGLISKAEYDTFNGKQDALTTTKSVKILSNNVELDGDNASPGANQVYGTNGSGVKVWKADPTGGGNSIGELTADVTAGPASSPSQSVPATLNTSYKSGSCGVVFDGQGGVISNGRTAYVQVPYKGTITGWQLVSSVSGSCTITVFKDTFANFPPVSPGDNIFVTQPSLSGPTSSATGLSVAVASGDWIGFTISGVTTVTWVNLTLSITKII